MIKTIVKDVFFLGQKSTEAAKEDLYLAKDLRDTLEFHKDACVGMAANMIGVKKRVIIVNIGFVNLVMFNPVLVCKSSPFQTEVAYLDEQWMPKQLSFSGMPAQIIQHELDHLEGIII